ncbi:hypothetical protein BFW01_g4932 [Lasiodiplodia theobromae]|nr:hypothetical protein BFW01_g4932 [Lasiodiplodia theobromae]
MYPLTIASSTAEPTAPPIARAENASPVAVDKNWCGALNCTAATSSVSGPACPTAHSTLRPYWASLQCGATHAYAMVTARNSAKHRTSGERMSRYRVLYHVMGMLAKKTGSR